LTFSSIFSIYFHYSTCLSSRKVQKQIVKRYGKYRRKASWIVKWYGKYERKLSWNVKWYENTKEK
jgi:hypothetical protein